MPPESERDAKRADFLKHLEECRDEIATWPEWMQGVLGGKVTSPPKPTKATIDAAADAARWREIALALASGTVHIWQSHSWKTRNPLPNGKWHLRKKNPTGKGFVSIGMETFDSPEAALLAWHAQRHTQPKEPT